jgi:hypothetical protein
MTRVNKYILPEMTEKTGRNSSALISAFFCIIITSLGTSSCAYRFTNTHVTPPEGIQSISVEAVFDTSREVLAHELLWESIQAAIIKDGNLKLTNRSQADAILRVHIKKAHISPSGQSRNNGAGADGRDPRVFDYNTPPHPNQMRPLTQAGRFKDSATMKFVVKAEVVSLRTKSVLLKKNYSMSTGRYYATYQGNSKNNWFLRYVEAGDAAFEKASRKLASKIVQDLMVR